MGVGETMTEAGAAFEATWASLSRYVVPEWYKDAKFGIFIHWGVYSVPAFENEWYPRNMYLEGTPAFEHHRETWGDHKNFGYKDFIPMFTAEKFDAAAWAKLFREAGARYVVPVAEHHDGFAMYDSALTEWTAAKMGPKRDLVGEIAEAVRAEGMVFGVSSHRAEHWWFFNGGNKFDSDVRAGEAPGLYGPAMPGPVSWEDGDAWHSNDWLPRPDGKFLEDWLARTCELVDKYRPQVVWFDWWIEQHVFTPWLQRFAAYYYNRAAEWGVGVGINDKYRAFPEGTAVYDIERGQLKDLRDEFWQTDTAVAKTSWGYIEGQQYKTAPSLLHDLIDIVSKNGVLLLNIGPRPDGTIPDEEQALLREIGAWLAVNGEAIYETRPWKIYGEGPTEVVEGAFQDTMRAGFTARDVRYTRNGETVYGIALGMPEAGQLVFAALGTERGLYEGEISRVSVLGCDDAVAWTRMADGLHVTLPASFVGEAAVAVKVERG